MFGRYQGDRQQMRQTLAGTCWRGQPLRQPPGGDARSSYKAMARVLAEQCEVQEETVTVKKKTTGGDMLQNPRTPMPATAGTRASATAPRLSRAAPKATRPN